MAVSPLHRAIEKVVHPPLGAQNLGKPEFRILLRGLCIGGAYPVIQGSPKTGKGVEPPVVIRKPPYGGNAQILGDTLQGVSPDFIVVQQMEKHFGAVKSAGPQEQPLHLLVPQGFVKGVRAESVHRISSMKKGVKKVNLLVAISVSRSAVVALEAYVENGGFVASSRVVAGNKVLNTFFLVGGGKKTSEAVKLLFYFLPKGVFRCVGHG